MIRRDRLRQLREERGLSQEKLGRLIGKDGPYVWKIESGTRHGITSKTLRCMAVALGVSADYLLGLDDCETRTPQAHNRGPSSPAMSQHQQGIPQGLSVSSTDGMPASVEVQTDAPSALPLCPHCAVPMQPMADGRGIACLACRYTIERGL
jgi:transcriptional regulator with XRE-family HTH domain